MPWKNLEWMDKTIVIRAVYLVQYSRCFKQMTWLSCAKLMVKSITITIKNYVITAIKHKNLKGSFKFYLYFNIKIILFELYLFFKYEIFKFLLIPKGDTRAVQGVHTDHKLQTERRQLSSLHSLHTPVLLYRTPTRHFPCVL